MISRAFLLLLALAFSATAQEQQSRLLLPIAPGTINGANGSAWQTDLVLSNIGTTPITIAGHPTIAPGTSLIVNQVQPCQTPGAILLASADQSGQTRGLAATLRTRDLSRQAETWGTSIPTVTALDYHYTNLGLNDVPMTPEFRSMLRIYGLDIVARGPGVAIRFYKIGDAQTPDQLLLEIQRDLSAFPVGTINTGQCVPSVEVPLDPFPELRGAGRIRIEVDSMVDASSRPYWAFVSVTHNQTQHVTLILPH